MVQRCGPGGCPDDRCAGRDQPPTAAFLDVVGKRAGQPLPPEVQADMEARFGADFSEVRIHTDARAAQSAAAVSAAAYTITNEIVFGHGSFIPGSPAGRHTLAHELAHVQQQRQGPVPGADAGLGVKVSDPSDSFEQEAKATASRIVSGTGRAAAEVAGPDGGVGRPTLQRSPAGPVLGPVLGTACTAYSSQFEADLAYTWVRESWLTYARAKLGPETADLWDQYLSRSLPVPRPLRSFTTPGDEIVEGFRNHHRTAEVEVGLLDEVAAALTTTPISLPPDTPVPVSLSVLGPGTVWSLLNKGGRLEMVFDSPATTIPGNIAGGISGGVGPDTRNAWGEVSVINHVGTAGATTGVEITSKIIFAVHDTVDFCPGGLGGLFAQAETLPMSRLEATGTAFGAPFAGPVPFDVIFAGPGQSKTYTTIPTTPTPAPTPPGPGPAPGPTPGPRLYTVAPGDYLYKIANDLCGDPSKWKDIYAANTKVIGSDPNLILPGQSLTIPCASAPAP